MPVSLNAVLSTGSLIADQAEMLQKVELAFLREFENLLRLQGQLSQSEDDARMTSAEVAGCVQIVSAKQTPSQRDDFSDGRQHSLHKTAIVGSPPLGCESPPTSPTSTSGGSGIGGDLYKTELCRAFEERGQCRYGEKCQFAHGVAELRSLDRHPKYKTELCRTYHSTGFCPYGARCHFVHNEPHLVRLPTSGPAPEAIALTPTLQSPIAFASVSPTFGQPLACGVPMAAAATTVPNTVQPLPLMTSGQSTTTAAAVGTRYSENLRQLNTLAAALDAALKASCSPLTACTAPPPPPPGLGQFPVSTTPSQPSVGPSGLQQKCNATTSVGSALLQHRRRPNMETTLTVGLLNDVIIPDVSMTHLNQPRQQHCQQHQVAQPRYVWAGIAASTVGGSRSPAIHRLSTATADSGFGSARNSVCSPTVLLSSPDDVIVSPTAAKSALYDAAAAAGVYSFDSVPSTSAARVGTALRLQPSDTNASLCCGRLTPRAFADWPLSPVGACKHMMASCHKSQ